MSIVKIIFALSNDSNAGFCTPNQARCSSRNVSWAVLEHFSCYCIAYPQWANQAEALLPVTWDKASVMAASRLSTVRALAERSCCLIFDHACSMGLKSGE